MRPIDLALSCSLNSLQSSTQVLHALRAQKDIEALTAYGEFFSLLAAGGYPGWTDYVIDQIFQVRPPVLATSRAVPARPQVLSSTPAKLGSAKREAPNGHFYRGSHASGPLA